MGIGGEGVSFGNRVFRSTIDRILQIIRRKQFYSVMRSKEPTAEGLVEKGRGFVKLQNCEARVWAQHAAPLRVRD